MGRIKSTIKNIILDNVPLFIKNDIISKFKKEIFFDNSSFAQEGEDKVLLRFLERKENGFYVDIGAHHPIRFSNTYLFYLKGWRGINADAMPGSMELFKKYRPNDINLEIPLSNENKTLTYYLFNESALNTFSAEQAAKKDGLRGEYRITGRKNLKTFPLSYVLDNYLPSGQTIDFLSIDVEGLDFEVLSSNNWTKYQPSMILVESLNNSLEDIKNDEIYKYLKQLNYSLVAKTFNTLFFKKN